LVAVHRLMYSTNVIRLHHEFFIRGSSFMVKGRMTTVVPWLK